MATFIMQNYAGQIDRFGVESGRILWHADTITEARSVGDASIGGVPLVGRQFGPGNDPRHYQVTLTYEGKSPDGPPTNETQETAEGEAVYVQEPIELHPRIETLLEKFGGTRDPQTGKVTFPDQLPQKGTGSGTGLSRTGSGSRTNPMAGRTTYAVVGGEVLHTYVREQLPGDIFEDLNMILDHLPSAIPSNGRPPTPRGRNWLKLCPRWNARGNVVQIVDRYRLSPPGGFTKELYDLLIR